MISPDINILVYAHREDSPYHQAAKKIIMEIAEGPSPFALAGIVASGFIRIVTNPRIFLDPTPLEGAIQFIEALLAVPHCRMIEAGGDHWPLFIAMAKDTKAFGNAISDVYLASIIIEHGCELLSADADFAKFPKLRYRKLNLSSR